MANRLVNKVFEDHLLKELRDWQDILAIAKANMENPADENDYYVARLEYDSAIDEVKRLTEIIAH